MATQDGLLTKALEAVKALFADNSVPESVTKSSLKEVADEIEILLDSLN